MTTNIRLLINHSLAGVAVLAVLFMFSASLSGQGTAPAFASNLAVASRPADVPQEFVITPFGYFHPSCVLQVAEGDTLLADGRVEHANGTVEANVPVCNYPHYTPTGLPVTADTKVASGADPVVNGWLEAVWAMTNTSYGKIAATWIVPPAPATAEGQTLFFFPGFEDYADVISIVQPVLQFGPSAAGGGNYWAVASWNCCLNGYAWNSKLLNVSSGDTILGTITSTCKAGLGYCAKWNVTSQDKTTGKKTTLAKTPAEGQVWNWAFGAVAEVYGVVQCSDYPPNNGLVFTVKLFDQNRKLIKSPPWTPYYAGSGTTPWCNYGLNFTPKQETVEY
jgi:hypothetical protein